jgi:hypothetical protein
MLRKIGTPTYAAGWWFVPVAIIGASRGDKPFHAGASSETCVLQTMGDLGGQAFVELITATFPVSQPRKAAADLGLRDGFGLVAAKAAVVDGARAETNQTIVLQSVQEGLEVIFLGPVASAARDEICAALEERLRGFRGVSGRGADTLQSDWDVRELLAELAQYTRADDGSDLLAFRIKGSSSARTMYIYLYGGQPDLIHFDLEDPTSNGNEWDAAIGRGSTRTTERLLEVAHMWLDEGRLIPSGNMLHMDDGASP